MRKLSALALAVGLSTSALATYANASNYGDLSRPVARGPQSDESVYFVVTDRFENGDTSNDQAGLTGGRLASGYEPSEPGWWHGGDLKGLTRRLSYIRNMGFSAIWITPPVKQRYFQGSSAGYHGYWITDFTQVDPHFGTNADFKALVDAAHARGMKVYMDIIINHTADVIQYRECMGKSDCPYRDRADYPYQRQGGVNGKPINPGFMGDGDASADNWAKLTSPDYAYTPFIPDAERKVKVPASVAAAGAAETPPRNFANHSRCSGVNGRSEEHTSELQSH